MTPESPARAPRRLPSVTLPTGDPALPFTGERYLPAVSGEIEIEHLHRYVAATVLCQDKDVLDLACGEGYGSYVLSQVARSVCGVDVDEGVVRYARGRYAGPGLRFLAGSCAAIPLPDRSADVVVSFETIEHVREHDQFLQEVKRVLRPEGVLVISTPDKDCYNAGDKASNPFHLKELTRAEFEQLLRSHFAGVRLLDQRTLFASLLADGGEGDNGRLLFATQDPFRRVTLSDRSPHGLYVVAVCSDAAVPALAPSLYEGVIKSNVLSALQGGIAERDQKIAERDQKIAEQERLLAGQIAEHDRLLAEQAAEHDCRLAEQAAEHDRVLAGRERVIAELNDAVAQRQEFIRELQDQVARESGNAADLQHKLTACTAELERLNARYEEAERELRGQLAGRDAELAQVRDQLRDAQTAAVQLRGEIAVRAGAEDQLRQRLAATEEEASRLRAELAAKDGQVGQLQQHAARAVAQLTDILRSRSWKAVGYLQKLKPAWRAATALPRKARGAVGRVGMLAGKRAWHLRRCRRLLAKSPLFDATYYLAQNPDVARAGIDPLTHYLAHGAYEGRDPNPVFDGRYYLAHSPDVAAAGSNPLVHYLTHGAAEGRNPHPLFDTSYYLGQNADVAAAGVNPLAHFLAHGIKEGRDPHPLFDTSYYLEHNPDVAAAGVNPVGHYAAEGAAAGRDPNPLFDSAYYLRQNPDVAAAGLNPLAHYLARGAREDRDPNPYFGSRYYLEQHPHVAAAGMNPLHHYLAHGRAEMRRPGPDFDPAFYLSWNEEAARPDVNPLADFYRRFVKPAGPPSEEELQAWVERLNQIDQPAVADDRPQASLVVPAYNQLAYTLRCVESLLRHQTKYTFEIIIVDDCSTDATPRVVPRLAGVSYTRTPANCKVLKAYNHGAARARGDYLVLLNNDVVVLDGWLDELLDTFATRPEAGLVGCKLLYPTGRLQEAGGLIWRDGSGWNYGHGDDPERPKYNYVRSVDYCSAAAAALPRWLWHELGGFDVRYAPAYYEDTDLAFRVRESGRQVLYQPAARVVHFEGVSCGRDVSAGTKACQVVNARKFRDRHQRRLAGHAEPGHEPDRERDRGCLGRVLCIDHCTPTPDQDSGSRTTLDLLHCLQGVGCKVTFLADNLAFLGRYTRDLERAGIECDYHPHLASVEAHLREHGRLYDAVVLFRAPFALKHIDHVKRHAPQAKVIFHTMDLHYLREERQARVEGRPGLSGQALLTKARELSLAVAADCTVVVSQFEKDLLAAEMPGLNVYFFPYVMPVAGRRRPFEGRGDLLFVGGYNHVPNVDAVQYFVGSVFPLVRARLPGVKFYVVGSNPPQQLLDLARDDVIVVGYVPDLDEYLDRVRLTVAPLRYGAGIKGKVVMSMSRGVPGVVSSVAAEGMNVRDGREVLVADDPQDFADAVARAYRDADLWQALSDRGLDFVAENYSAEAGRRHVAAILASVGLPARVKAPAPRAAA